MEKFICKQCNSSYVWILKGKVEGYCVYCCGEYPNGTKCSGGKGNIKSSDIQITEGIKNE